MVHVVTTTSSSVDIREEIIFLIRIASVVSTVAVCMVQKLLTFVSNVVCMSQYLAIYST